MAGVREGPSIVNREQLSHVLRAAVRITGDDEVIVLGSQAILGTFRDGLLPTAATQSIEVDVAFRHDSDEQKSDLVDTNIGELSLFHEQFGYYGQGVSINTAVLPVGWEERVVAFDAPDHPEAVCIDAYDLVVAKLVAGREKDFEFAAALISHSLIEVGTLQTRVDLLDQPGAVKTRVLANIDRCAT